MGIAVRGGRLPVFFPYSDAGFGGGGVSVSGVYRQVGEYVLTGLIAKGGMGEVYRARQVGLGRVVALKLILPEFVSSPKAIERQQREARAAARLDHPHIVRVHEAGEADGEHYLAMQFIDGEDLEKVLERGLPPRRQSVEWLARIASAVAHAHARGVLHRDIKPANILIEESGVPYLADFGLAKIEGRSLGLSREGSLLGTCRYMAPEQARGPEYVTTAVDVWALGAVLRQCLSGHPPWQECATEVEILGAMAAGAGMKFGAGDFQGDEDLRAVCEACLAPDPAHRYATASELAADLEAWLRGRAVTRRPIGRVQNLWRLARRHRLASTLILASAGLALAWGGREIVVSRGRFQEAQSRLIDVADLLLREGRTDLALARLGEVLVREPGHARAAGLAERVMTGRAWMRSIHPPMAREEGIQGGAGPQGAWGTVLVGGAKIRVLDAGTGRVIAEEEQGKGLVLLGEGNGSALRVLKSRPPRLSGAGTGETPGDVRCFVPGEGRPRELWVLGVPRFLAAELAGPSSALLACTNGIVERRRGVDGSLEWSVEVGVPDMLAFAVSGDGSFYAWLGQDQTVVFGDARTGRRLGAARIPQELQATFGDPLLQFSGDGGYLVAAGADSDGAAVFGAPYAGAEARVVRLPAGVRCAVLDPVRDGVIVGCADGSTHRLQWFGGRVFSEAHERAVQGPVVVMGVSGPLLVVGATGGEVGVLSIETGRRWCEPVRHPGYITLVDAADGTLTVGSVEGWYSRWRFPESEGSPARRLHAPLLADPLGLPVISVQAMVVDGARWKAGGTESGRVWLARGEGEENPSEMLDAGQPVMSILPDAPRRRMILCRFLEVPVTTPLVATGAMPTALRPLPGAAKGGWKGAMAMGGDALVFDAFDDPGAEEGELCLYSLVEERELARLPAGDASSVGRGRGFARVRAFAVSADGGRAGAVSGKTGVAHLWDLRNPSRSVSVRTGRQLESCACSPRGDEMLLGTVDGGTLVWRPGQAGAPLEYRTGPAQVVAYGARGERFAGLIDGSVARLKSEPGEFEVLDRLGDPVVWLATDPGRGRLIACTTGGAARVWEVATGVPETELLRLPGWLNQAAFLADGTGVLLACKDGSTYEVALGGRSRSAVRLGSLLGRYGRRDLTATTEFEKLHDAMAPSRSVREEPR